MANNPWWLRNLESHVNRLAADLAALRNAIDFIKQMPDACQAGALKMPDANGDGLDAWVSHMMEDLPQWERFVARLQWFIGRDLTEDELGRLSYEVGGDLDGMTMDEHNAITAWVKAGCPPGGYDQHRGVAAREPEQQDSPPS